MAGDGKTRSRVGLRHAAVIHIKIGLALTTLVRKKKWKGAVQSELAQRLESRAGAFNYCTSWSRATASR